MPRAEAEQRRGSDFSASLPSEQARHDYKKPIETWIMEYVALYYLLDLDDQWDLEFGTSPVMHSEISQIRELSNHAHEKKAWLFDMYDMLAENAKQVELMPLPSRLVRQVSAILPNHPGKQEDVNHLCQAILGNWDRFLTTDKKSILAYSDILKAIGIITLSPLTFLETQFMTLRTLVRTLHGAQANVDNITNSWLHQINDLSRES